MEEIIEAVKKGDKESFRDIIRLYENDIYRYILKFVSDKACAEDLTQEVFIKAYTKIGQYKKSISFKAWLYKIAKNITLNHIKREKKIRDLYKTYEQPQNLVESYSEAVECALDRLEIEEKNLLILKSVEDLSFKELKVVFNKSEVALRKQYQRIKVKFKNFLSEGGTNG